MSTRKKIRRKKARIADDVFRLCKITAEVRLDVELGLNGKIEKLDDNWRKKFFCVKERS